MDRTVNLAQQMIAFGPDGCSALASTEHEARAAMKRRSACNVAVSKPMVSTAPAGAGKDCMKPAACST